ncbi:hypothetical protein D3C79_551980 [compost metagenome]
MHVLADVLVQGVHVGPALRLAKGLQPGAHIEETGAGRRRVGHDDLALVFGLGQVLPAQRLAQALLLGLDGVEAEGRGPHIHADPGRRVGGVAVVRRDRAQVFGRIGFEHAVVVENGQAGSGQAPHHVGLRAILLGQQLGGDDARRIAHPLDLDVRVGLFEGLFVTLELFGLKRAVDSQLRPGGRGLQAEHSGCGNGKCKRLEHDAVPYRLAVGSMTRRALAPGLRAAQQAA